MAGVKSEILEKYLTNSVKNSGINPLEIFFFERTVLIIKYLRVEVYSDFFRKGNFPDFSGHSRQPDPILGSFDSLRQE